MACVLDPLGDGADVMFTAIFEIFQPGGKTPPNTHRAAQEMFLVLQGEGIATCDGVSRPISTGDVLLVRPGAEHVIENTGTGRLYCFTVMVPDEDFAALIRGGTPVALDGTDLDVLTRAPGFAGASHG
jgi:mannose-6-phosphate isomerase-like protein (cupin superfamily)